MAGGEHVYATLLLSDSYLPGALVLAHSLRDAGTSKKLAVLVTLDSVSAGAITQLKAVYDYVLPVPRIRNDHPSNLYLMNRGDLHSAFTKINLWKQLQFDRIVYIDADVVAYRAPDELFNVSHSFAAAPDIGWPDLFNTGVMVLSPNMGDFYAMMAMAERGISFDGADQGLLNMHFKNSYHRLSFTYNVTPSAHYQYIPAYRHFQSSINMVHFIGSNKPWFAGRNAPHGASPFDEMVGRWWAVYDRHYRVQESATPSQQPQSDHTLVQYFTKGEFQPQTTEAAPASRHEQTSQAAGTQSHDFAQHESFSTPVQPAHGTQAEPHQAPQTFGTATQPPAESQPQPTPAPPPIAMASWDASRQPPPVDSKPEALNFPSTHYSMSQDAAPFVPPARYPSPPKNMYYEVPKQAPTPVTQKPRRVFPWEGHQPRPSRTFAQSTSEPLPRRASFDAPQSEPQVTSDSGTPVASLTASSSTSAPDGSKTPITAPNIRSPTSGPWTSFQLSNAWDDMPEIGRYVEGLQKHRRGKSLGSAGEISSPVGTASPAASRKPRGLKLTDFPSETERPSLPVTPAPIARPSFWGTDEELEVTGKDPMDEAAAAALPAAEGVPGQQEWVCVHGRRWRPDNCVCDSLTNDPALPHKNPEAQLQKLAREQYEHMLRRLSGEDDGEEAGGHVIPKRHLPFGSEDVMSPTYVAQTAPEMPRPSSRHQPPPATGILKKPAPAPAITTEATNLESETQPSQGAKVDAPSPLLDSPMPRSKTEESTESA